MNKRLQSWVPVVCVFAALHEATGAANPGDSISQEDLKALGAPAALWKHFAGLSSIPRCSKQETKVLDHIKSFAKAQGLSWQADAYGNVLVHRQGSGGGEAAEPVLLQGHVDMVCEKNSVVSHDFKADPIRLRVAGDWLQATNTTLGSDNGIGLSAILSLLEAGKEARLPPIQALFTVDEETGLNGAFNFEGGMVSATRMLNLDSEEFGDVYIGCAGGGTSDLELPAVQETPDLRLQGFELNVTGLLGGHSGVDIHLGRGNAVVMAAAVAASVLSAVPEARLVSIQGGNKDNAIPREAHALLALPEDSAVLQTAKEAASRRATALSEEFRIEEPGLAIAHGASGSLPELVFPAAEGSRLLAALLALPHGVIKMSHAVEGLVETSNNVASVQTSREGANVVLSTRSSIESALEAARDRLQAIATLYGGTLQRGPTYPGWAPMPEAPIISLAVEKLAAKSGTTPKVLAIHAGLECGILLQKCPSVKEAVSFGPTIVRAHSPDEAVEIASVRPFFEALQDILGELASAQRSEL